MIYIDDTPTLIRFPRTVSAGELEEVTVRLVNTTDRRTLTVTRPASVDGGYIAVPDGLGVSLEPGEWEYTLQTAAGAPLGAGILRVKNENDFPVQPTVQYENTPKYEQYFTE